MTTSSGRAERTVRISTHTPLAGRDQVDEGMDTVVAISTHTPLAGRDKVGRRQDVGYRKFLLTRPLRDVTQL